MCYQMMTTVADIYLYSISARDYQNKRKDDGIILVLASYIG